MKTKTVLTLVKHRKVFYPRSLLDYEVLFQLGVPTLLISSNFLPALVLRAKRKKIQVNLVDFDDIHAKILEQVASRWTQGFESLASSVKVTVPNTDKIIGEANKLIEALQEFYRRNQYNTDIKVRKSQNKLSISLHRTYDDSKSPELKG